MKVSLVITTYNWKEALSAVLLSVKNQTRLPDEVIIADDGSKPDTKEMLDKICADFPIPLIHSWQKDDGFRAASSRNKAIAKSNYEYIIIIDGDIYLTKDFVKSHANVARQGWFVQGCRVQTNQECANNIIKYGLTPSFLSKGLRNRKNCINNTILAKLFSTERNNDKSTRSCNMAFWKNDVIEINGFNEDFVGWGREDSEFVNRMLNADKRRLYLKFAGAGYHLYHKENSRESLKENDQILEKTINKKLTWCVNGIDKYL